MSEAGCLSGSAFCSVEGSKMTTAIREDFVPIRVPKVDTLSTDLWESQYQAIIQETVEEGCSSSVFADHIRRLWARDVNTARLQKFIRFRIGQDLNERYARNEYEGKWVEWVEKWLPMTYRNAQRFRLFATHVPYDDLKNSEDYWTLYQRYVPQKEKKQGSGETAKASKTTKGKGKKPKKPRKEKLPHTVVEFKEGMKELANSITTISACIPALKNSPSNTADVIDTLEDAKSQLTSHRSNIDIAYEQCCQTIKHLEGLK